MIIIHALWYYLFYSTYYIIHGIYCTVELFDVVIIQSSRDNSNRSFGYKLKEMKFKREHSNQLYQNISINLMIDFKFKNI